MPAPLAHIAINADDVAASARAAVAAGGRVLADPVTSPGVGDLAWLADPAGNVLGAMRYD